MNILRILLLILVVGAIGWIGYFYFQNKRLPALTDLESILVEHFPLALPSFDQNNQALTETLVEGKNRVETALEGAIEVASDSSKPVTEKALNYGRYLYCQQIVREYENR